MYDLIPLLVVLIIVFAFAGVAFWVVFGDELQSHIGIGTRERSANNQYADEEVRSGYTYPKEYKGPKPIVDQINALARIFGLDPSHALEYAKNLPALPEGAEGWFAVPTVAAIATKHFPEVTDPGALYCRAVDLVHTKIAGSRSFYNYRDGQITPAQLRVSARTAYALDLVSADQPGDVLIIAAQLGLRHRARSVRCARASFTSKEFGLTSLAVGSIVLVHPERLVRGEELDMECSGDEFDDPDGVDRFSHAPLFYFGDGRVEFGAIWFDFAGEDCGSASAFLPQ